jgi:hypothetical protein
MRRREGEEDASPYIFCDQCQQMFERILIQECPYCFKDFCRACAVRSGNQAFCSKPCAKGWFFAEADEDEAEEREKEEAEEREKEKT